MKTPNKGKKNHKAKKKRDSLSVTNCSSSIQSETPKGHKKKRDIKMHEKFDISKEVEETVLCQLCHEMYKETGNLMCPN
jgi:hypothetical protein